jgi:hypothetical protein
MNPPVRPSIAPGAASGPLNQFDYKEFPLEQNQIRLLRLHPAKNAQSPLYANLERYKIRIKKPSEVPNSPKRHLTVCIHPEACHVDPLLDEVSQPSTGGERFDEPEEYIANGDPTMSATITFQGNVTMAGEQASNSDADNGSDLPCTPDYTALSYTWGEEDYIEEIYIIHERKLRIVQIKPNLDSALRALRDEKADKFLWTDAICINQSPTKEGKEEKSAQIPLMAEIYGCASQVCIWLGDDDDETQRAVDFMGRCANGFDLDEMATNEKYLDDWAAMLNLMRRPWFSRRW